MRLVCQLTIFSTLYMLHGLCQANLVLIAYASSDGSGEPVHPRSLARTSATRSYEGWSKSSFLFLIQRKVRVLSKFFDVHIELKYVSSHWMLFEKQLWHHSLWHVTSRDTPKGVIVVNHFTRVASAKFEIFIRSKKHLIPLRNVHLKLIATDPNTVWL